MNEPREKLQQNLLNHPAYIRAYEDLALLNRDELRPIRLQLELLKPEMIQQEHKIVSTIVVFGSARTLDPESAEAELNKAGEAAAAAPEDASAQAALARARKRREQANIYSVAHEFSRIVSSSCQLKNELEYVVVTGGGPGIMEAGNRGAHDSGAQTIGLNIALPHEQRPNPYITPDLCFNFRYFAIRKMHFLMRARALVAFPGGFGTLDELFEALTLIQTHKVTPIPVVLVGRTFWERLINFPLLLEEEYICPEDLELFSFAETATEIWQHISDFHAKQRVPRMPDHFR